ncbi:MAG TPA: hypothetical protein VLG50_04200 [Candidatus Saccharimonadales bacterium]|nr:hypothetical protein [Candidatus Saccharimonadales bacterium]
MIQRDCINSFGVKVTLFFLCLLIFIPIQAIRYVSHKQVSTDVELIDGKEFSHTITSDKGVVTQEFSIDRVPLQQDDYYKALDAAYLSDMRKERQARVKSQQERIAFIDDTHRAIVEKSTKNTIFAAQDLFNRLNHESLRPYLKFGEKTIQSPYQLAEMKKYVDGADSILKDKNQNIDDMQEMFKKIETWPDRLQACFKESVQSAIAQCDDTTMLKELLTLASAS